MERKVSTIDLAVGMHVSNLDRPWLDTPFLLQGFIITGEDDDKALQQHCQFVFIGTDAVDEGVASLAEQTKLHSSPCV